VEKLEAKPPGTVPERADAGVDLELVVNGHPQRWQVHARTLLVHALRDNAGLTGTKVGCDSGVCGACTVHVDGLAMKSCTMLAAQAAGASVTTIEGIGSRADLHALQRSFVEEHALQCGFCTPGMVMSALELLGRGEPLDREAIAREMSGNLCRCTGYENILRAIERALREASGT
jgi:aerobic carbon-monoxide dehydrogenase small subunit